MGSRVAVMSNGVLQQVGTPQEVYDRPATTFVATFLGTPPMNLFRQAPSSPVATKSGCGQEHPAIATDGRPAVRVTSSSSTSATKSSSPAR